MNEKVNFELSDDLNGLIARYLDGSADIEEVKKLESWVEQSAQNRELFCQFKNIWESSGKLQIHSDKALDKVLDKINHLPAGKQFLNYWQKAAAILILPLLVSTIWLISRDSHKITDTPERYKSVIAAFGTISTIELPDGTKVWLNSGSTIRYPEIFKSSERTVDLSGEAYFEVKSDAKCPFYVNAKGLHVKATGTRFNVMAYEKSDMVSVALAEGKVAVKTVDKNNREKITTLKPSQSLKFKPGTGNISIVNEEIYKYYAWKDGKMVFRNDLLSEVAYRISLQYNVDVEIQGDNVKQYRYYATFQNESLREVFDLLKISSPFDYRIVNQKVLPDGTFSRRKVTIFPSNSRTN
jgi:transmembrane sensor